MCYWHTPTQCYNWAGIGEPLYSLFFVSSLCCNIFYTPKAAREGPWRSASHHLYIICLIPTLIHKLFSFSNLIWLLLLNCCTIDALFLQSHLLKQLYSSFSTHPSPLELLHHPGPAYRIWKNGQILLFKVSKWLSQFPRHDRVIWKWPHCLTGDQKGAKKIIPLLWIKSSQKPQIIKLRKKSPKSGNFD